MTADGIAADVDEQAGRTPRVPDATVTEPSRKVAFEPIPADSELSV
jgi:hypothetical protein